PDSLSKFQRHTGSDAFSTADRYFALMRHHGFPRDGQAEACPRPTRTCGEKGIEDPRQRNVRYTAAVILDHHLRLALGASPAVHTDFALCLYRFRCVVEDVIENLRQLGRVAGDGFDVTELQLYIQHMIELGLQQMAACAQETIEITGDEVGLVDVGEGLQICNDRGNSLRPTGRL